MQLKELSTSSMPEILCCSTKGKVQEDVVPFMTSTLSKC